MVSSQCPLCSHCVHALAYHLLCVTFICMHLYSPVLLGGEKIGKLQLYSYDLFPIISRLLYIRNEVCVLKDASCRPSGIV